MEKSSLYYDTIETYSSLLRKSSEKATRHEAKMIASQQQNSQLKHAMKQMEMEHTAEIEKYKSIFKQHDTDMNEALSHIKVLRGKKEDKLSALNLAWLKLDELLVENNELSHHLNDAKRQQLFVARDRELINTVESLTQQLKTVSEDKDNLTAVYDDVNIVLMHMNKEYELLEFRHHQMTDTLTPILTYIQRLLRTSEQQHAIILELTSLVHSLHSSLELSKSDAQIQSTESQYAIDAIAAAAGEAVAQQTARYEMERAIYMEDMEMKLARTEDEAFGAVQAVAEAAGKLEYERKIEEETRWRTYVEEVENTLGEIGVQTEHDLSSRGQNHEEISSETVTDKKDTNKMRGNLDDLQGIVETSVLRAAISRRIEEGVASLQRYIHPYNYLKEKKSYSWEIKAEPEQ